MFVYSDKISISFSSTTFIQWQVPIIGASKDPVYLCLVVMAGISMHIGKVVDGRC